jgi:hemerythrin-like metal-binding protein
LLIGREADLLRMATATPTEIFPWSNAYSVGIPQIDTQHQGLVRLINDLHNAMASGEGKQALGKILDELVRYTEVHFGYEEYVLREKLYSKLAAHHSEHQKLTRQVIELRDRYRASKLALTVEVMQFLKNWLAGHIQVHDLDYAREFKGAGPGSPGLRRGIY